jgi:HTH-type transcriptional regulator / antitoxin HipB
MLLRTPKDIGALIRQRRRERDIDQQTLADRVGCSRKWISEAESGKPTMELHRVLKTLDVLGVRLMVDEPKKSRARAAPTAPDIDAIVRATRKR